MLHRARDLRTYGLETRDGRIGSVADLYFDDRYWTIRYLVADTGSWLTAQQSLISPWSVTAVNPQDERVETALTKEQVENSPSPDEDPPVSRRFEMTYNQYYGYSPYWLGPYAWGAFTVPRTLPEAAGADVEKQEWDSHLFSSLSIAGFGGYTVAAQDGDVGHVTDLLISDDDWAIRYLVIDTRDWLPGKKVLVPPQWTKVDWQKMRLTVDLPKDAIKSAPEYHDDRPVNRDYETELHAHYCRESYWTDDSRCYDAPGGSGAG